VGEYLLDDCRVFNASDHFDGAAAFTARFDVNIDKSAGEPICTALGCPTGVCGTGMYRINTRFNRWAQVIDARRSAGVWFCVSLGNLTLLPLPRFAGVTCTRCLLFGANTP